jgi:hypothetical protein
MTKLTASLDIFTELNMPRERDAVRLEEFAGPISQFWRVIQRHS